MENSTSSASNSISRTALEAWATSGPIFDSGAPDNSPRQERIVLCGEGFAEDWAWVEGALKTGVKAGDKVIEWLTD